MTTHLFCGFQKEKQRKDGRKTKGQITARYKHKYKPKARIYPFNRQLKINHLVTYATILNYKTNTVMCQVEVMQPITSIKKYRSIS